jgi:hypothetical protein
MAWSVDTKQYIKPNINKGHIYVYYSTCNNTIYSNIVNISPSSRTDKLFVLTDALTLMIGIAFENSQDVVT